MGKRIVLSGLALAALLGGTAADGATVRVGTLVLHADGGFTPRALPKRAYAPIDFRGHADIVTTDGSVPPALQEATVEYDRDGLLTTAGLPVCPPGRIENAGPQAARRRCAGAIVGSGHVGASIGLAGLGRVEVRTPLTLFNGPRRAGDPTVVAHTQATVPALQTFVVSIPIERRPGAFRYRTHFEVPKIVGGLGALTHIDVDVGRRYRSGGVERSYVSARCSDYILQTRGSFSFADGNVVSGSVFKPCTPLPQPKP